MKLIRALGTNRLMLDGPVIVGSHLRLFLKPWAKPYARWGYGLLSFGAGPIGCMWWPR